LLKPFNNCTIDEREKYQSEIRRLRDQLAQAEYNMALLKNRADRDARALHAIQDGRRTVRVKNERIEFLEGEIRSLNRKVTQHMLTQERAEEERDMALKALQNDPCIRRFRATLAHLRRIEERYGLMEWEGWKEII
jgi:chromosome segregation ATPase